MEKRWRMKPQAEETVVNGLAKELNVDKVLANILAQRGIKTLEEAKHFFRPSLDDLHDPFLMKDMDKAIARIEKAIQNNEKILVYGDYDVDGTTAVALVYTFLKRRYDALDYYIPDRYAEGYGISFQGIDYAKEHNFTLIIDCDFLFNVCQIQNCFDAFARIFINFMQSKKTKHTVFIHYRYKICCDGNSS